MLDHPVTTSSSLFPVFMPLSVPWQIGRKETGRREGGRQAGRQANHIASIQYELWISESICSPCVSSGWDFKCNTGCKPNHSKAKCSVPCSVVTPLIEIETGVTIFRAKERSGICSICFKIIIGWQYTCWLLRGGWNFHFPFLVISHALTFNLFALKFTLVSGYYTTYRNVSTFLLKFLLIYTFKKPL